MPPLNLRLDRAEPSRHGCSARLSDPDFLKTALWCGQHSKYSTSTNTFTLRWRKSIHAHSQLIGSADVIDVGSAASAHYECTRTCSCRQMRDNQLMEELPLLYGPGPPESVQIPTTHRVSQLIPFVHVEHVERSIAFYHHLGFIVESIYKYRGRGVWAELRSEEAVLMVSTDGDAIDPAGQGVLFYLYSRDLASLRAQMLAQGVSAGEIHDGTPGPKRRMRLADPDGYVVMVAEIEPTETN